ncbi:DUF4422 domain-containing protein [Flammeovirga pacifica]|uniref:DUF4422 domain-containing protein n=1 Tax=Flammeovirga pacifica TaxID=915059 RepID=A0A1S1Z115_FLAPC|nr:DUF4422 domain-containing protein [Flammeovirga pacifica]OHX66958.1 hypothetical protein NH26_11685 [Flammeovirga pacifica]
MIFVIHHKEYPYVVNSLFQPIQVGAENATVNLPFLKDNTGDHISEKNPYYAELTALYWIWKNFDFSTSDFVGLSHYRRFFDFSYKKIFTKKSRKIEEADFVKKLCKEKYNKRIKSALKDNDILISRHEKWLDFSIKQQYLDWHIQSDWEALENTVLDLYPEYKSSISKYWNTHPCYVHLYNMFVMKVDDFKIYVEWLFSILFELETRIDVTDENYKSDPYQTRVFGFMAERLLNLYINHNNFNKKEYQNVLLNDPK